MNTALWMGIIAFVLVTLYSWVKSLFDRGRSEFFIALIVGLIAGLIVWGAVALIQYVRVTAQRDERAETLVFAGQVINSSMGDWNDRMVLVYERDKEVGRGYTFRGEFPENNLGVIDGLFVIEIPNSYQLSVANLEENKTPFDFHLTKRSAKFLESHYAIYHWFPNLEEGGLQIVSLPSKSLYYIVKILEGNIATLPSEILNGKTEFKNGLIMVLEKKSPPENLNLEGQYTIQEIRSSIGTENNIINKFTVPLDNCASDQELRNPYIYTQTFVHKYYEENSVTMGAQASLPAVTWLKLVAELQTKYGFENNQINETNLSIEMTAAPHTYQYFIVTWAEVWEKGIALVVKDNQPLEVPFRVKTNVVYQVTSETRPCP